MAIRVKVSQKNQIAVPSKLRKQLGISKGDSLLFELRDGYALVLPDPDTYVERLHGLHREVWQGVDPEAYVAQERDAWQT